MTALRWGIRLVVFAWWLPSILVTLMRLAWLSWRLHQARRALR